MERTEQYIDSLLNTIRTSLPNFAKQTLSDALRDQAADAQATIAALEAEVKDLKEWLGAYKQSIELAQSEITQRTAELEAANEKVQFLEKKNSNLLDSSNTVLKVKADQDVRLADLQAELERVRGLIKALPKVEGEIEVSSGVYNFILLKHDSGTGFLCGQIETEQTARAIAALWKHRQGME